MQKLRLATAAAALALLSAPAFAQSLSFSGGLTLTSNYMSRGVTQSDDRPALQGYVELDANGFYAGLFASTVRLAPDNLEVDLYAGYRWSVNNASFDVGYARYWYDDSGDCCGEIYALFELDASPASFFGGLYYDPDNGGSLNDIHLGVGYSFAANWSVSATAGRTPAGGRYGILGVDYTFNDNFSVGAAYHITNQQDDQFVVSVNYNF